jgi:PASTA domain
MSEDERTALLNPGSTGRTRRITTSHDDHGGYDGEPERGNGRRIAIMVAAAVVVGLLGLIAYLIFGRSPTTRQVAVPAVSGQQLDAARAALQAANLLVSIDRVASTPDQKDQGVGTDPTANTQVPERSGAGTSTPAATRATSWSPTPWPGRRFPRAAP